MRLVGEFDSEKQAFTFSLFLQKEKIQNIYEPFEVTSSGRKGFRLWVFEEDDYDDAYAWYEKFKKDPGDPIFHGITAPPPPVEEATQEFKTEESGKVLKLTIRRKISPFAFFLTHLFLIICIGLFILNTMEKRKIEEEKGRFAAELLLTPIQKVMMFDYPAVVGNLETLLDEYPVATEEEFLKLPKSIQDQYRQVENLPYWKGFYHMLMEYKKERPSQELNVPFFEKIREGQVWRLFTPCLLHTDFLHILFNMAWLWVLGRQIEERVRKGRMLLFIVVVAIVSNVAQYLMSGPYFLGFSGVVVGMAGFIWSRQKKSPWEGYPLQRTTLMFILFFVVVMFGLEIASFALQYFSYAELTPNIANTAHVVGGLTGLVLGRLNYFARGGS